MDWNESKKPITLGLHDEPNYRSLSSYATSHASRVVSEVE